MSDARPHPFTLIFASLADSRFPAIRDALTDRAGIDAFLLAAPALDFLRELRPDTGLGEGIDDLVALVHAAYRFWATGARTVAIDEAATRALCSPVERGVPDAEPSAGRTTYIQIAPRLIWGRVAPDEAFEPLDGWFVTPVGATLSVVACLGVHPARPGVSVVAVTGGPPDPVSRVDGSPPFAPTMPGGDAAGLFSVATPAEVLLLAWRAAWTEENL